ncbi:MAG: hypothetical protein MK358_03365 [Vicinamibacterales bacterium]|nr:hypothetical protein [Vicinamibacterales bacterium]
MKATLRRFATAWMPRRKVGASAGVALTVYDSSADVKDHVAPLKRLRRFRVTCVHQRKTSTSGPMRAADLAPWELASGHRPDSLGG